MHVAAIHSTARLLFVDEHEAVLCDAKMNGEEWTSVIVSVCKTVYYCRQGSSEKRCLLACLVNGQTKRQVVQDMMKEELTHLKYTYGAQSGGLSAIPWDNFMDARNEILRNQSRN